MIWNILIDLNNIDLGPLKEIYSHSTFSSTFTSFCMLQQKYLKKKPSKEDRQFACMSNN